MQSGNVSRNYRPFTMRSATNIAKRFDKVVGQEEALFDIINITTRNYEQYLLLPDLRQKKDALEELGKAIETALAVAVERRRHFEGVLEGSLFRLLAELLTYEGIERLLNKPVSRHPLPGVQVSFANHDELTRLGRSIVASQVGPELLVSLLSNILRSIEDTLAVMRRNRGGRPPKHLLRLVIILELVRHYDWFSDEPPTSTTNGHFSRFCSAVLEEMEFDLTGFEQAIHSALKSAGYLRVKRPSRLKT